MFQRLLAAAAIGCLACGPLHAASALSLVLRADVTLDHARVVLSDVASVSGDDLTAVRALEQVDIGRAPRVAYMEMLSRAQIDQVIRRRNGAAGGDLAWSGAQHVTLRTAAQTIGSEALLQVAKTHLLQQFGEMHPGLQAAALTIPERVEVPAGPYQLSARQLTGLALATRMPVWVDVMVDGAPYRSVLVPLQVKSLQRVFVAQRALAQGAALDPADLALQLRDVVGMAGEPVGEASLPRGGRLLHAVAAGQVLTLRDWSAKDLVMRGDRVRLALAAGAVRVETMAQADGDAAVGELVRVKPESGLAWIAARVVAPGVVQVDGK